VRGFPPRSLLGQMLLLMGAALLVAQLVNFAFILNEQQKLSLAQNEGPAIIRFAQTVERISTAPPAMRAFLAADRPGPGAIYRIAAGNAIDGTGLPRNGAVEKRLAAALAGAGVHTDAVRGATLQARAAPAPHRHRHPGEHRIVLLSARLGDGSWISGRFDVPRTDPYLIHRLLLATLVLYALVLSAVLWIAARLGRPLRALTLAAERFEGRTEAEPVEPSGPSDIRQAIFAFNAMNERTVALLDEKDRMLGAIGHDLRTPLASIRIRAEAMGPEDERSKLVATVEEMAATLEDILVLARTGRAREQVRPVDVSALADALVEEYRALGRDAAFEPSPRIVLDVQPNLLRRALRNLIDNAVAYAGQARVRVREEDGAVEMLVDDDGPGIDEDRLQEALEPFSRLDESRNRGSGGAGLGLAIARAVAQAHGGDLTLSRRPEGGLSARIVLPRPEFAGKH
jgi:signal transduction histidine kinase